MAAERRRGGGPGKEKRPEQNCCLTALQLLYRMRASLLTFPSLPLSPPELLILKMGLWGFKSFSNHTAEGSLWVSRSREASLTPVMFRHLGWGAAQRITGNYFLASTHLPGSLACEISKVNSVSPPPPSLTGCLTIVKKKEPLRNISQDGTDTSGIWYQLRADVLYCDRARCSFLHTLEYLMQCAPSVELKQ